MSNTANVLQFEKAARPVVHASSDAVFVGTRYQDDVDITAIAKLILRDLRAASASGEIAAKKFSVRCERYSMGCSINITIGDVKALILNPRHVIAFARSGYGDNELIHSTEGRDILRRVEEIAMAYNRTRKGVDLYHCKFHLSVHFDSATREGQRKSILFLAERGIFVKERV